MTEGWPYEIVYKNKDEAIPLTFGGQRNRFVYLVALLRAKMRGTMTGRDFQTYQNVLEDLASLVHVTGYIVYDKWIEEFYTDGRAYDAHAYSQAITTCNSKLRKMIDNESLRIKTSGGRDSVAILPLEPEQIIVADDFIPFMERLAGKSENKPETGDGNTYAE